jgi:hypothetical protein
MAQGFGEREGVGETVRPPGGRTTAITSNISLSDWGRYLGDATITAAILDRLVMNAIRVVIDGPSRRQHVAQERDGMVVADGEQHDGQGHGHHLQGDAHRSLHLL